MEEEILNNLKTDFMGRNILYYNTIDSTHKEAKRIVNNDNIKNGTIIVANMQTDGIGTHNRKWYTKTGENITFNIILYPNCNVEKIENITIVIAECIVQVVKQLYGLQLDIKYPNDVLYKGKKIAGILTREYCFKRKSKELNNRN